MQANDLRTFVEENESLGEATPGIPFYIKLPFLAGLVIVVYGFFVWLTGNALVYFLPVFGICLGLACRYLGDSSRMDGYLTGGATLLRGHLKTAELPIEQWRRIQVVREATKVFKPRGSFDHEIVTRFKYHVLLSGDGLPIPFPKTDSDKKLYRFLQFLDSRFVGEAVPPTPQFQGLWVTEKENRTVWLDWSIKAQ